jgi:ABC-type Fe3+/spermidine/putrescine transport system ATPase subunit
LGERSPVLEIKGLSSQAGRFRLRDVSVKVARGECHVIMGPNGAGKTLLLETLAGFRRPREGEILFDGENLLDMPVELRHIGFLPQDLALFPHLTVEGNILYGLRRRGWEDREARLRVSELCEAVGIANLLKRQTTTLSGGEKQRVALVRALAPGCRLLLLDEPFSALDRSTRREMWFLVKELQESLAMTVLMVTHDMEEALFLGDTMSVMIDGSIRQTGARRELFENPNSVEVAQLMGIRNLFRGRVSRAEKREIHVRCQELNGTFVGVRPLHSTVEFVQGAPVTLGIRAEEVAILDEENLNPDTENALSGTVISIFEKGTSRILLFEPSGSRSQIEIEERVGRNDPRAIEAGRRVTVQWRRESLLVLPEPRGGFVAFPPFVPSRGRD